jgi:predicted ArsR family transcriptional regulator
LRARFGGGQVQDARGSGPGNELAALDTKILCELAVLEPGYASSAIDVARALSVRAEEMRDLLDALQRRGLVVRTLGGGEGESGYTLSQRGRAALLQQLAR